MSYGATAYFSDGRLTQSVLRRRVLAWFIDVFLLTVIVGTLWLVLSLFGVLTLGLGLPLLGVLPAVPFLYHFLFLAGPTAATPGQQVMGLTVRRDDDLGRPQPLQALVCVVVFYFTLATSGLLLLVALFTVRKRTLHDILSGLVVVRRRAIDFP